LIKLHVKESENEENICLQLYVFSKPAQANAGKETLANIKAAGAGFHDGGINHHAHA
jgi:hypothetical protein